MTSKGRKPLLLPDAFVVIPDESIYGSYPYNGLQILGFIIVVFFPSLSLTVCGLRVYSRRLAKGFGMDDWLIFLAMALALAQGVFTAFVLRSGYWGIHDRDVPSSVPANLGAFWVFINGLVYNPLLALVKVSALLFLLRLGGTKKRVRLACRAMIVFNLLQLAIFLPVAVVQCLPIESPWVTAPKGVPPRCIRRDIYSLSLAVVNIVTDVLTLLIPFLIFLDLKVNRRVRSALLAVFLLGGLVTIVSGVRLYYIVRLYYHSPGDRHFSIGYVTSSVEINLAIITASVPALWPLARRWFPGAFETLGINRPYMYPDIELAYATQRSRASRILRGKVIWSKSRHVPSGAFAAGMEPRGLGNGGGEGGRAAVKDILAQPGHLVMQGRERTWSRSNSSGYSGSSRSGEKSTQWQGDEEEDDEMSGMTYHDAVRGTESRTGGLGGDRGGRNELLQDRVNAAG